MMKTKANLSRAVNLACLFLGGALTVSVQAATFEKSLDGLKKQWSVVEDYCTKCHNFDDYAGGIDLSLMTPEDVAGNAETFEMVLRKLRASVMPPPSQDQPTRKQRWDLVASLEETLDSHAAEHPNPGRVGLHRLNRTEYVNAIKDITGVELDPEFVLPKDDNSDGFDNIAAVLKVSPTFLDQYISSARVVSDRAVGTSSPRNDPVFYPVNPSYQGAHIHGLPLGTRGGVLVEHEFPVDGEYSITIPRIAGAGYTLGMEYEHTVVVTLDGQKIFERSIGGGEDLRALDQLQAPAVAEINGRFKNIPITVTSGKHEIGAAFIARSFAEGDEFLHSLGNDRGMDRIARMPGVEINGPFSTNGVINTESRNMVMVCEPGQAVQELECAHQIFANLAKKAYRRPITEADLVAPLRFYAQGRELGGFDEGIKNGMMAIFTSPKFLFRAEIPEETTPGSIVAINDLELASRLSFFLWSTVPDEQLLDLASRNQLTQGDNLNQQVARMLEDPRSQSLVDNFAFEWLRLRDLPKVNPDTEIFPNYSRTLLGDFEEEIRLFIADIIKSDGSVHDLITSDSTFLNEDLALHYGITNVKGDQFRKVQLAQQERYGLLGKGGVQMVTSYANRTTPVIRGAYIMENFLGVPPASPPRNVPAFPETEEGAAIAQTVRARLGRHRDNPACAGCHDIMDPLGLALENFSAIGEWRVREIDAGNAPIDASGQLADGTPLEGVNDLRKALVAVPDQFAQVFTEKLLTYAIGRGVEAHDMPTVRKIVDDAAKGGYKMSALINGVIASDQFQKMMVPVDGMQIGNR